MISTQNATFVILNECACYIASYQAKDEAMRCADCACHAAQGGGLECDEGLTLMSVLSGSLSVQTATDSLPQTSILRLTRPDC